MSRLRLWNFLSLLVVAAFTTMSCGHTKPQSIIRMADLHTQRQLLSGFSGLEAGAWRWTGKTFTVSLAVPAEATTRGGVLTLQGTVVPDALKSGPLQINSTIGNQALPAKSVTGPGEVIYQADVPGSALTSPTVVAQYSLSSTFQAPGDRRDLGIIVSVISLKAK